LTRRHTRRIRVPYSPLLTPIDNFASGMLTPPLDFLLVDVHSDHNAGCYHRTTSHRLHRVLRVGSTAIPLLAERQRLLQRLLILHRAQTFYSYRQQSVNSAQIVTLSLSAVEGDADDFRCWNGSTTLPIASWTGKLHVFYGFYRQGRNCQRDALRCFSWHTDLVNLQVKVRVRYLGFQGNPSGTSTISGVTAPVATVAVLMK